MASHYDVLGVRRDSSPEEIKRAYHRLALEYHPDKNPSPWAAERMKLINEAYRVLGDEALRSDYDAKAFSASDDNLYGRWYRQRPGNFGQGPQAWTGNRETPGRGYESPRRTVVHESVTMFSFEHLMASGVVGLAFGIAITAAFVFFGIRAYEGYDLGIMVIFAVAASALPPLVAVWLLRRTLGSRSEAGLCGSTSLAFALPMAVLAGSFVRLDSTTWTCCLMPAACILAGWVIGGFVGRMGWDMFKR